MPLSHCCATTASTSIVADDVAEVERAATPTLLVLTVQTPHLVDDDVLQRLAALPGDRLVVEPVSQNREILAPEIRRRRGGQRRWRAGLRPAGGQACRGRAVRCERRLRGIRRRAGDAVLRRRGGPLPRRRPHRDGRRHRRLHDQLRPAQAGQRRTGDEPRGHRSRGSSGTPRNAPRVNHRARAKLSDLVPAQRQWIVVQLCLVVLLLALWKGRRLGPLVAEQLPVVVRASETVEGRGRLYRSRRAGDRAADALRTATLQRMMPRLGLGPTPTTRRSSQAVASVAAETRGGRACAVTGRRRPPTPTW